MVQVFLINFGWSKTGLDTPSLQQQKLQNSFSGEFHMPRVSGWPFFLMFFC